MSNPLVYFENHVARIPFDTCWHWIGPISKWGYGQARHRGHSMGAHRFAYEILVGAIPEGLTLDHLCRNRACVNPAHLEAVTAVTASVNTLRGTGPTARNAKATHCIYGHELTPANIRVVRNRFRKAPARYCIQCGRDRSRENYRDKNPGWERRDYETHPEYPK